MPDIQAFRGLRYDLGHVGALSDVIAPPYDVIGPALQEELYKRHPANVVRLILNRDEPGDDAQENRYSRAARFLRNWRREGLLQQDSHPAVYVYHQVFEHEGVPYTRRGLMARVRLEPFGTGQIYPHEETHAAAKADRLQLMQSCRANLSQIFGLYPDPENAAQEIVERAIAGQTPLEAVDHLGVVHRMWPLTDLGAITEVTAALASRPMFVADGHHRYETACNYREQLAATGPLDEAHPANFVLTMLVSMNDPGMIVLPTHRLFRGLPPLNAEQLVARLGECFEIRVAGEGTDLAELLWQQIDEWQDQGQLAFYTPADQRWVTARLSDRGRLRMDDLASDHSADWRGLGVSILHRLVVENLLDARDLPKPKYVHLISELVEALESDDPASPEFTLAALVMPATLDHIRTISEHGERMPAKSTYFYPKLLSGLVINPLE